MSSAPKRLGPVGGRRRYKSYKSQSTSPVVGNNITYYLTNGQSLNNNPLFEMMEFLVYKGYGTRVPFHEFRTAMKIDLTDSRNSQLLAALRNNPHIEVNDHELWRKNVTGIHDEATFLGVLKESSGVLESDIVDTLPGMCIDHMIKDGAIACVSRDVSGPNSTNRIFFEAPGGRPAHSILRDMWREIRQPYDTDMKRFIKKEYRPIYDSRMQQRKPLEPPPPSNKRKVGTSKDGDDGLMENKHLRSDTACHARTTNMDSKGESSTPHKGRRTAHRDGQISHKRSDGVRFPTCAMASASSAPAPAPTDAPTAQSSGNAGTLRAEAELGVDTGGGGVRGGGGYAKTSDDRGQRFQRLKEYWNKNYTSIIHSEVPATFATQSPSREPFAAEKRDGFITDFGPDLLDFSIHLLATLSEPSHLLQLRAQLRAQFAEM